MAKKENESYEEDEKEDKDKRVGYRHNAKTTKRQDPFAIGKHHIPLVFSSKEKGKRRSIHQNQLFSKAIQEKMQNSQKKGEGNRNVIIKNF